MPPALWAATERVLAALRAAAEPDTPADDPGDALSLGRGAVWRRPELTDLDRLCDKLADAMNALGRQ